MKKNSAYGIDFEEGDVEIKNCKVCAKGKQCREPFPKSETVSKKPLELIHSDLMGPMETASQGGSKYLLTFVDDYSKKVFVYFLKQKSEVLDLFKEFKIMVENETEMKIKKFRSDNEGEYLSKENSEAAHSTRNTKTKWCCREDE